jgi:hypothetical protein
MPALENHAIRRHFHRLHELRPRDLQRPPRSCVLRVARNPHRDIPKDSGILARMQRAYRRISNIVTFTGYRKFEAESTIDFKAAQN